MKFKVRGIDTFASTGGRPFDKNKPLHLELMSDISNKMKSEDFKRLAKFSSLTNIKLIRYIPNLDKIVSNINKLSDFNRKRLDEGL